MPIQIFDGILSPLLKSAMEFPTEEALKKYLKEHPKADPGKHSVIKTKKKKNDDAASSQADVRSSITSAFDKASIIDDEVESFVVKIKKGNPLSDKDISDLHDAAEQAIEDLKYEVKNSRQSEDRETYKADLRAYQTILSLVKKLQPG